jgi:hypothetical protein
MRFHEQPRAGVFGAEKTHHPTLESAAAVSLLHSSPATICSFFGRSIQPETYAGVVPTGTTECSAAIQAALAAGKDVKKIPVNPVLAVSTPSSAIVIEYDVRPQPRRTTTAPRLAVKSTVTTIAEAPAVE